jgi:poly(3-hydroxybutyrate) depolymerase
MCLKVARVVIVLLLGTASCLGATLTKTTTTISSSLNPSFYLQAVTFTATVTSASGFPTDEEIMFEQGANVLGTGMLNSSGSATFTTSTLAAGGTDNIKAVYPGDSTYGSSTSKAVAQVVNKGATTTTLSSSQNPENPGQSVTFTAVVTPEFGGTVTGNVAFDNGSTTLATKAISGGVATYTTTKLAIGTATITAVYKGSTSYATSTSSVVNEAVINGTTIQSTLTWDNVVRYYQVYVPAVLPPNPPMLLMLHGTKFTSTFDPTAITTLNWGWQSYANADSFILVQPASTWDPSTSQWNWNAYFMDVAFASGEAGNCAEPPAGTATGCPDDAGFLRELISSLTSEYNVNKNAIYVTGFSSGAQMTERVGVEISDLVAAIAPVSGQMAGEHDPPTPPPPLLLPGKAVAPISVQEWQGTLDQNLWPCGYGTTEYSGVSFVLDTVDDTFNYWVGQNSCTTLATTQTLCSGSVPNSNVTGNLATGCKNNTQVQFIWEDGIGHAWEQKNIPVIWSFLSSNQK